MVSFYIILCWTIHYSTDWFFITKIRGFVFDYMLLNFVWCIVNYVIILFKRCMKIVFCIVIVYSIFRSNAIYCIDLLYSVIWNHIAICCITLYYDTILKSNVYYFILHLFHVFLRIVIFLIYCVLYFTVTAVLKV